MATTSNLLITLPTVGGDDGTWGTIENGVAQSFDDQYKVTPKGDTGYTILSTDRVVRLTTAFTASRTFTLPAASAFIASQPIVIIDAVGAVSSTNTLVLARAGSDTIVTPTGTGATSYTLSRPRLTITLRSNGTDTWVVDRSFDYESGTWTPTAAFATPGSSSIGYATQTGRYTRLGDTVFLEFGLTFTPTVGTASGSLLIGGLPFSATDIVASAGSIGSLNANFSYTSGASLSLRFSTVSALRIMQATGSSGTSDFTVANVSTGGSHAVVGSIWYKIT